MHALEQKIADAKKSGRIAVVPFLTAGFPDRCKFWASMEEIDRAGADIIEIGVPFSDPVADGPVVEDASRLALGQGITLREILKELTRLKGQFKAGLVLMGYYNPFLQYGLKKLAREAHRAGVSGLIIPDLPIDEAGELLAALEEYDIALVPLVGPNTGMERMRLYSQGAKGYAYVVSVMGITGERKNLAPAVAETMQRARSVFDVPLALGFGLSHPRQLAELPQAAMPDAAVIGSALLRHIDSGATAGSFLKCWFGDA